jgi:PAS domain S-box-containing protein
VLIELTRNKPFPAVHPGVGIVEPAAIGAPQLSPAAGRFERINPKILREYNSYSEEELFGMAFSLITHPHYWEEDSERFRRMVCRKMSEYVVEKRYAHKHGSVAG